ncbi:MAG: 5'/3'-nucleotidase SurE [Acidobacteria bacterium]|nr:5'/3'-nucleotidase SurE [Acidobacteriota bacterium]
MPPHILITNDDGIHAEGLRALLPALAGLGTLSVVAPSQERSASAQALTLRTPIVVEQIAEREWSVEGTPTDSVILALNTLLTEKPDIVVSGINRGGNMGENVYYSGTVGAAMEGCINGIPSLAFSVAHRGKDFDFAPAAQLARKMAELTLKEGLPNHVLLNVNVPQVWNGGVRFTRQSGKITRTMLQRGADPRGRPYFWLHEQPIKDGVEPGTDYAAVFDGAASVTPLQLDRTHNVSLNHLSHWAALLEKSS